MKKSFINFIPVLLPVLTILLFFIVNILESFSRNTVIYSIVAFVEMILLFFCWIPNMGLSIFVFVKNVKKNSRNTSGIVLGIVEIFISFVWFLFCLLIFIRGQGI